MLRFLLAFTAAFISDYEFSHAKDLPTCVMRGYTMGTYYQVHGTDLNDPKMCSLIRKDIKAFLSTFNDQMSTYLPKSQITQFNQSKDTGWFPVSYEFAFMVNEAKKLAELTDSAFESTIMPLYELWGFGPNSKAKPKEPDQKEIKRTQSIIGSHLISARLLPPAIKKTNPATQIDLSAIAKGYAVDMLSSILASYGSQNHMVEIGGEIKALGKNTKSKLEWSIAIEKPGDNGRSALQKIKLKNSAIATSGSYRSYKEIAGKRIIHIIDPRTGLSVNHKLASVSIIAPNTWLSDAYATALMVLGEKDGLSFANKHNIAAFFIVKTKQGYTTIVSEAMKPLLIKSESA